jgi:predicted RNA binding protein YcfA (HicA-like mRNA interferase family)
MGRVRQMAAREVLRAFATFGFTIASVRGSHAKLLRVLASGERQILTVPLHKQLAAGTLRAIFRQALRYIPEEDLRPWFFHQER